MNIPNDHKIYQRAINGRNELQMLINLPTFLFKGPPKAFFLVRKYTIWQPGARLVLDKYQNPVAN
jgi:hypothetical protein